MEIVCFLLMSARFLAGPTTLSPNGVVHLAKRRLLLRSARGCGFSASWSQDLVRHISHVAVRLFMVNSVHFGMVHFAMGTLS